MHYIIRNIPQSIFYFAFIRDFLKIAHSSLLCKDFNEKALELLNRMKAHGAESLRCRKELSKIIRRHVKAFANFGKECDEILSEVHI